MANDYLISHGLDFARVAEVFRGATFTMPDDLDGEVIDLARRQRVVVC